MPNVTVYIREADMGLWRALENKSQAISALLNSGVLDESLHVSGKKIDLVAPPQEIPGKIELQSSPRTAASIVREINELHKSISDADYTNQDPDYWDGINKIKAKIEALWAEWHKVTGK